MTGALSFQTTVAIRCADLGSMVAFYRDVPGLEAMVQPRDDLAFFRLASGHGEHKRVSAVSRDGGPLADATGSSLHHLALNVDYAMQNAAADWLEAQALAPRVEVFGWVGCRGVFLRDPEGNTTELVAHDAALKTP